MSILVRYLPVVRRPASQGASLRLSATRLSATGSFAARLSAACLSALSLLTALPAHGAPSSAEAARGPLARVETGGDAATDAPASGAGADGSVDAAPDAPADAGIQAPPDAAELAALARSGVDPALVQAFARARKAMVEANLDQYDRAVATIPKDHPLQRYVEYWRLRILLSERRPESTSGEVDGAVHAFIAREPEALASDLLRRDLMLALGRREDWRGFDAQYARWILRDETAPECYAQLSRLAAGRLDRDAALALVMRPVSLSRPCRSLYRGMADAGALGPVHYRQRFFLALEANAPGDIRDAAALAGLALQGDAVDQALRRPAQMLRKPPASADVLLIALIRLIRSDADEGARRLEALASRLGPSERRFAWSQLAASGARRMMPEAYGWMQQAHANQPAAAAKQGRRPGKTAPAGAAPAAPSSQPYSDDTRRWLVRAALRQQDWRGVARLIDDFSPAVRAEPEYHYWRGRAHAALGQKSLARSEYEAIGARLDYYGKLAREELGRPIDVLPRARTEEGGADEKTADLLIDWNRNEAIQRARAFYDVGLRFEGNREWNYAMRALTPSQMRSVAWWAQQNGLLDRAINTDERLGSDAVAELRFPTPHAELLVPIANGHGIDPSWAYGLIRQESRFVQSARSTVGAAGLMQLMPATARWVARQLGHQAYAASQIDDLRTNIEFGTFYLRRVLDNVDGSALLASAGYNAGPARARSWRASLKQPLEGAIFAELIPFTETRSYVKHVLSNTVDYAALASGRPQSLKRWLGQVTPASNEAIAMP